MYKIPRRRYDFLQTFTAFLFFFFVFLSFISKSAPRFSRYYNWKQSRDRPDCLIENRIVNIVKRAHTFDGQIFNFHNDTGSNKKKKNTSFAVSFQLRNK